MRIKNTSKQYGIIAILFHWIMAILIIGLLGFGLYMTQLPISLQKLKQFGWHKEWGILVLILVLMRVFWRIKNITPSLPKAMPFWEKLAAGTAHAIFYGFMFILPLTGWLITSAAGLPVSFFGWFVLPNLVSANENTRLLFTMAHEWLSYALIALLCLHIIAALKHHFINKDDILRRIL